MHANHCQREERRKVITLKDKLVEEFLFLRHRKGTGGTRNCVQGGGWERFSALWSGVEAE